MLNCGAKVRHSFEISYIFARKIAKIFRHASFALQGVPRTFQHVSLLGEKWLLHGIKVCAKVLRMGKILGIGNALVDALVQLEDDQLLAQLNLPKGSMQLIDVARYRQLQAMQSAYPVKRTTGGSACNTILAVAHLGGQAGLIGKVGSDEAGTFFTHSFEAQGVSMHLLVEAEMPTGVASTFITPDGQRTFGTFLGAASALQPSELRREWFEGYSYFYIEGYLVQNHALISRAVSLAREAGLKVCVDMASYNIVEADRDFFAKLLPLTDIVFANEQEAAAYTGHADVQANVETLSELCRLAVVKVGKNGVIVREGNSQLSCPACDVPQVVDTTAAGDYFSAGFLYAHSTGRSLMECARLGSLLSGHIIEVVGTALPQIVWQNIRKALPAKADSSFK